MFELFSYGVSIIRNTVICGRGPALEVDQTSLPGLISDQNQYKTLGRDEAILYGDTWLTLPDWTHQTGQDRHSVTETTAALIGFLFHVSRYPAALQRSTI